MEKKLKPEILKRTTVAESRFFVVEGLQLHFSNGEDRYFECIGGALNGSVMIIPLLDQSTLLLIREYGAGIDDYVLGFPKGAVENEEDVFLTANRELKEEVGYGANNLAHMGRFSASPGYSRAMMDIVLATDLYPQQELGDEPEPIEVIPWKLNQLDELLVHPEFHEIRSIAALFLLLRTLNDK